MLRYFCFLAVLLGVKSAAAPFVKACKQTDTACILSSAQAFIPTFALGMDALKVPSVDPMLLKVVKTDQAGLQLTLRDTTVTGLRDCTIEGAKLDTAKLKLSATVRCSVVLKGQYKLGGQVLILPVQGEGRHTIKIRDIIIKANADLTLVEGADGKHWHINKWRHTFQVKTSTTFDFENLFNGNTFLSDPLQKFVNENWREVMTEIAPPIVRAIVQRVVEAIDAFFAAVPAEQLYMA